MNPFALYVRATEATWPLLQPYAKDGDLFWGRVGIPASQRALTFPHYEGLLMRAERENLADYSAISLDGEYADFALAMADAPKIRAWADANGKKFSAFYHLNIIDAHPGIVQFPDVVVVGKTNWNAGNMQAKSAKYLSLIRNASRTPSILLGDLKAEGGRTPKVYNTPAEVLANMQAVLALGVPVISYFYHEDESDRLLSALAALRGAG